MHRKQRKWGEEGKKIFSGAVEGLADRAVSAAISTYRDLESMEQQLDHLDWLVMEINSTVMEADRVRIQSWPLRRWLWNLREAECEGKAVARSCRQRRTMEAATGSRSALWERAKVFLRSVKKLLLGDEDADRLSSTLRRLDRAAAGLGNFIRLLELEILARLQPPPTPPAPAVASTERHEAAL